MRAQPISREQARNYAAAFPKEVFMKLQDEHAREKHDPKLYTYMQLDHQIFIEGISQLMQPKFHFCDVGCGAGDKLALMHTLYPKAKLTGIEITESMSKHATRLCPFATIKTGDARFASYDQYDLIYSYTPATDIGIWFEIVQRIMMGMKKGAILAVVDVSRGLSVLPWKGRLEGSRFKVYIQEHDRAWEHYF